MFHPGDGVRWVPLKGEGYPRDVTVLRVIEGYTFIREDVPGEPPVMRWVYSSRLQPLAKAE